VQSFNDETYAAISSRSPDVSELGAWSKVFARSAIGWADSGRNANSARIPVAPSGSGMWATGRLYRSDQVGAIIGNYYCNSQIVLIRFGHLSAVDNKNLNGAAFGLELETKVFAQSGQE